MAISFHKGHGTRNDFILFKDPEGMRQLTPELVRRLADRRGGVGADGVIRVVRAGAVEGWDGDPGLWFMDYWNADGSLAEMCGNGLRVFVEYLLREQLSDQPEFDVATRAGVKHVRATPAGIAVGLGKVRVDDTPVTIHHDGASHPATPVDAGNPHAVAFLDGGVADLDLHRAPTWEPAEAFPSGVNVEFVEVLGPDELRMRVFERGVGETESCGTGVVATAAAHRRLHGGQGPVQVHVPGGTLRVDLDGDEATLTGPAVIVAKGQFVGEE